jgi:ubiquitin-conjugating enzyme E2 Q
MFKKLFKKKAEGEAVAEAVADASPDAEEELEVVADVSGQGALADALKSPDKTASGAAEAEKKKRDGGAALYRKLEQEAIAKTIARQQGAKEPESAPTVKIAVTGTAKAQEAVSSHSKIVRSGRLMKEFERISKCESVKEGMFTVALHDDNLFEWDVHFFKFDADSALAQDLAFMHREYNIDNVWFRVSFPDNFPFAPPFIRVLAPLVQGGYVLNGGAICLELLTPDGWVQACKMDAVIIQVVAAIAQAGARIVPYVTHEYSETEARKAYDYLVKTHAKYGWRAQPKEEG